MKKRSKLDLNPDAKQEKSQAAGFDAGAAEKPEPLPQKVQAGNAARQARSYDTQQQWSHDTRRKRSKDTQQKPSSDSRQKRSTVAARPERPTRAMFLLSAAVIAVAAVSLLLLKRR